MSIGTRCKRAPAGGCFEAIGAVRICDIQVISNLSGFENLTGLGSIDGSVVDHWPLQLEDPLYGTPCIGDVDEDGKNEIIAGAENKVYMWDTEGDANRIAWGHTG
ncbi:MAG: hypothetical protein U5Q03_12415 [Bacteroidota bacterium]|nr:hypothetical protein [Bacteroidota bacterium]